LLLNNETYRQTLISEYLKIKKELGEAGAAERTAEKIVKLN
jgi:hypothetical protein